MNDELFFDSNVICYAYDLAEPSKRDSCLSLVEGAFEGKIKGIISNQILVEIFNAFTRKLGVSFEKANLIVRSFVESKQWRKLDYNHKTLLKALEHSQSFKSPFLDVLISETMKENGITSIVTENKKDFTRIPGIVVINPFE
ncbi:MAG: PIN domain-containing protein [Candidatus Thermoplasmatota archaeon]|jgi:predicted nucleic acid-binding protein|nr:PIN domain-containing protein [Candidatus Thermoplasmatota archaeon]